MAECRRSVAYIGFYTGYSVICHAEIASGGLIYVVSPSLMVNISQTEVEMLRFEDFQYGGLTLNFDLDLSKLTVKFSTDAERLCRISWKFREITSSVTNSRDSWRREVTNFGVATELETWKSQGNCGCLFCATAATIVTK